MSLKRLFSRSPRVLPRVFYLAPDWDQPSWGLALLYEHVAMLRQHDIDAAIVHLKRPFKLSWIDLDVPVRYLDSRLFRPRRRDLLVVPEILAGRGSVLRHKCRKIVFAQGSFLLLARLDGAQDYAELGYEGAITILPHLQRIIERYFGVEATLVPPYVAPYFFVPDDDETQNRQRQIVHFPKAGSQDHDILVKILRRELRRHPQWQLVELSGLEHRQVAKAMRQAAFFCNVNCREAFNTTVPEAMAAGCIPVCFEAFGGRDYLRDGDNAYVFPNNHVYPLIDKLLELVASYDARQEELTRVRVGAMATARRYTRERTEAALLAFFRETLA